MSGPSLALDTPELAQHYEAVSLERQYRAGLQLLDSLRLRCGELVLDIGCGTGRLALQAADVVGAQGRVIGIDPLTTRLALALPRSRPNLTFTVGNVYMLDAFEPESFDVVYLNAVFHWLDDKVAALTQIHRVLRPGGRIGIATGSREHPGVLQRIRAEVLSRPEYATYPQALGGAAQRIGAAELSALLAQTGFTAARIDIQPNDQVHADAEAAIDFAQATSFGNFLGHLPAPLQARAREQIRIALDEQCQGGPIAQEGARLFAVALRA